MYFGLLDILFGLWETFCLRTGELTMARRDIVVYKRWEDGFIVRSMTHQDAKIVQKWYNAICPTSTDLDIALDVCDPSGKYFFVGELNGEMIASIANVPVCDNDEILYCSYFYVEEKYRKFGYGRRIYDEVSDVAVGGAVLAMDSHDELEGMQKKRGCTSAFRVTLYQGSVDAVDGNRSGAIVEELSATLWDPLLCYDDICYIRPGSQLRHRLLEKWTKIPGGKTVVALRKSGDKQEIVGYGCRRPSFQQGNHLVGPLYADSADVAWDVLAALTQDIAGQKIWINICEPNVDAVKLVNELRLKDDIHMIRMHKNGDPGQISPKVIAITSIDIGGF